MITCNFSIRGGKKTGSPITTFGDDDRKYLQIRHSGMLLAGDSVDFDPKDTINHKIWYVLESSAYPWI